MAEMSRKKIVIAAAVAAAAAIGAYAWWSNRAGTNGPLVLQGNVEVRQVNLSFKVAGRIERVLVDEGDTVKEGQTLASLDKVYFEDSIRQATAQRDQSAANLAKMEAGNRPEEIAQAEAMVADREASVTNAKITMDRAQALLRTASGSQKTYDDALAASRSADAQLNSARAALRLMKAGFRKEDIETARGQLAERNATLQIAERQLADADLKAPGAGIVLSRVREAGAIVNAGETAYVLSLVSPVWVRTYVAEPDLGRIRPGQPVEIKTDSPNVAAIRGRVGFISATAEFTPKTVETRELRTALVYRVRIVADDPKGELRQGMPLTATLLSPDDKSVASGGPK